MHDGFLALRCKTAKRSSAPRKLRKHVKMGKSRTRLRRTRMRTRATWPRSDAAHSALSKFERFVLLNVLRSTTTLSSWQQVRKDLQYCQRQQLQLGDAGCNRCVQHALPARAGDRVTTATRTRERIESFMWLNLLGSALALIRRLDRTTIRATP